MEPALPVLRTLAQFSGDEEWNDFEDLLLSNLTPAVAQISSLGKTVCMLLVGRAIKNVIEAPSTQVIHDLLRAWRFIISTDNPRNTRAISSSVAAASLKWIITATVTAVIAIDNETFCQNADQQLLLAVGDLTRQLNCGLRSPQYMASCPDRSDAIAARTTALQVMASFEETVVKKLMGDLTPEVMLERVRLEPECPVCMTPLTSEEDYAVLSCCTHALCVACARTWFRSKKNCPLCRTQGIFFKNSTLQNMKEEASLEN